MTLIEKRFVPALELSMHKTRTQAVSRIIQRNKLQFDASSKLPACDVHRSPLLCTYSIYIYDVGKQLATKLVGNPKWLKYARYG
jgi:hypothetical protein